MKFDEKTGEKVMVQCSRGLRADMPMCIYITFKDEPSQILDETYLISAEALENRIIFRNASYRKDGKKLVDGRNHKRTRYVRKENDEALYNSFVPFSGAYNELRWDPDNKYCFIDIVDRTREFPEKTEKSGRKRKNDTNDLPEDKDESEVSENSFDDIKTMTMEEFEAVCAEKAPEEQDGSVKDTPIVDSIKRVEDKEESIDAFEKATMEYVNVAIDKLREEFNNKNCVGIAKQLTLIATLALTMK